MESKFMTRNGALIRIWERGGQKYVRLCELAQGLGYQQYNVTGLLKQIIDAEGLSVAKDGVGRYEMELGQARRLAEAFAALMKKRKRLDKVILAEDLIKKLKGEPVGISLFDTNPQAAEPVAETTETPDDLQEVVGWAMAIAQEFGISQAEALRLASKRRTT